MKTLVKEQVLYLKKLPYAQLSLGTVHMGLSARQSGARPLGASAAFPFTWMPTVLTVPWPWL